MTIHTEFSAMNAAQAVNTLVKMGVKAWDIYDHCGGAAVARVTADGIYFIPDDHGHPMIVQPVYDGVIQSLDFDLYDDEPTDMIAWHPSTPSKWYFRQGAAVCILGRGHIACFKLSQDAGELAPLPVYQTPLEWLRNAGNGVCCLNRRSIRELLGLKRIITTSDDFAAMLNRELLKPSPLIPQIAVKPRNGAAVGEAGLKLPSSAPTAATSSGVE